MCACTPNGVCAIFNQHVNIILRINELTVSNSKIRIVVLSINYNLIGELNMREILQSEIKAVSGGFSAGSTSTKPFVQQ